MRSPQIYKSTVSGINILTPTVAEYTIKLTKPTNMDYEAGQFINIQVSENIYRPYSICNDPLETENIKIIVSISHNGVGADFFKKIKIKDEITFIGPGGRFTLEEPLSPEINFFTTGVGIAPIISYLYHLKNIKHTGKIRLYMGFRKESDIFYTDILNKLKKDIKDFEYQIYLSQPEHKQTDLFIKGRITLKAKEIDNPESHNYLCGNENMIEEVHNLLDDNKISEDNIFYEVFTPKR